MKKQIIALLILSAAALTGCGESDEAKRVRAVFITSCMSGGATQSSCECAHRHLAEDYSVAEIEELSSPYAVPSMKLVQDLARYAGQCRGE
ncbi:MAG: hypothetical protein VW877_18085 [Pseudomonadaceae bacterium]